MVTNKFALRSAWIVNRWQDRLFVIDMHEEYDEDTKGRCKCKWKSGEEISDIPLPFMHEISKIQITYLDFYKFPFFFSNLFFRITVFLWLLLKHCFRDMFSEFDCYFLPQVWAYHVYTLELFVFENLEVCAPYPITF